MDRLTKKQIERVHIHPSSQVTLTDMGHISEIQHMNRRNNRQHIQKIDQDHYVVLETGELLEFQKSENRSDNENSLRKTFKKLRYLINNNFKGNPNELHITLTYGENMTDTERLYKDFKRFMMRLKRSYEGLTTIDYINVVEPQGRGSWHVHMLIRFNDLDKVYIPNKWHDKKPIDSPLFDMWEQGWVTIKSLKDVDNIGAYLSAYLADIEIDSFENMSYSDSLKVAGKEISTKKVDGKEKKFIKGGRLHMYPPGMNLFRKSKGIKYPERQEMTYADAKKIVGSTEPHYFHSYLVERDDFKDTITYEQYNRKRN